MFIQQIIRVSKTQEQWVSLSETVLRMNILYSAKKYSNWSSQSVDVGSAEQ